MDPMATGPPSMKSLCRMSWRPLILMAVADVQAFCSPQLLADLEPYSSFRFKFLRARNENLTGRQALHSVLFDAFVEAGPCGQSGLPFSIDDPVAPGVGTLSESKQQVCLS